MAKSTKRVDLSKLSEEQRAAVVQFYKDCRAAAPHVQEMRDAARNIYQSWLQATHWHPTESDAPQHFWSVKPEVNYVDHIEGTP